MFTRLLFFVLLGCALALASPPPRHHHHGHHHGLRHRREPAGEKFAEWWEGVKGKINGSFDKVKNFWNRIFGNADQAKKEKLEQLKQEYEHLTAESRDAIQQKRDSYDKIIHEQEDKIQQLKQEAAADVDNLVNQYDAKFEDFQKRVQAVMDS